jgi:hypothetical protein
MLLLVWGLAASAGAVISSDSEPLPAYRKGTTFVYSDGTWETVIKASADDVVWKNHLGYISSGSPDFTHRRTQWETATRRGTRSFSAREDLFAKSDTSVWPLMTGKTARFNETGSWSEKEGSEQTYSAQWACEVAGKEKVAVPAGSFDTWRIDCSRFSVSGSRNLSRLWETKSWYYSPTVGHYVLLISKHIEDPEPHRQELLAVLPPADDMPTQVQRGLESNFQQALELNPSGRSRAWSDPKAKISADTTPAGTFRGADGTFCRQYVQTINAADAHQTYYGLACRTPEGKWKVLRR